MSDKSDSISLSNLLNDLRLIIDAARNNAVRSVDFCRVRMYWELGQRIVEEEQQGEARAQYGSYLLKNLAHKLEGEYGSGFRSSMPRPIRWTGMSPKGSSQTLWPS